MEYWKAEAEISFFLSQEYQAWRDDIFWLVSMAGDGSGVTAAFRKAVHPLR